jgi:hypothetical protein
MEGAPLDLKFDLICGMRSETRREVNIGRDRADARWKDRRTWATRRNA